MKKREAYKDIIKLIDFSIREHKLIDKLNSTYWISHQEPIRKELRELNERINKFLDEEIENVKS